MATAKSTKKASSATKKPSGSQRLRQLLEERKLTELLGSLERTLTREDFVFEDVPRGPLVTWQPSHRCCVVLDDLDVKGAIRTGADGEDGGVVVFLGRVSCRDLLNDADVSAYCAGSLSVTGLMHVSTPDSSFELHGPASIFTLYSGHGKGSLSTFSTDLQIEILDDYVEQGEDGEPLEFTPARPKETAKDVVRKKLVNAKGRLDYESVLEAFDDGKPLVR